MKILRVNEGRMVHETIDDETIVIDLETGTYYSLRGTAMALWPALVAGSTVADLTAAAARTWSREPGDVEAGIASFLDELSADDVIVAVEDPADTGPAEIAALADAYEPPVVVRYTNMSDLLLLDPIHDVDEQGWPSAPGH